MKGRKFAMANPEGGGMKHGSPLPKFLSELIALNDSPAIKTSSNIVLKFKDSI